MNKIMIINPEMYGDYYLCPSLYNFRHILNYNEILSYPTSESKNGEIVHRLIDNSLKNIETNIEYFAEIEIIADSWAYFNEAYSYLIEKEINSEWTFYYPIEYQNRKIIFSGRIDCFFKEKDKLVIIDWKTTQRRNKLSELMNNFQLDFYAYVLAKIKKVTSIETRIVYLNLKKEVVRKLEIKELENIEKKLFSFIENSGKKIYPADPFTFENGAKLCKICHFYSICEEYV